MIAHGPVDVFAFALGEPRFDSRVLTELERQTASGTIRVLDVMVLFKMESGECLRMDMEDFAPEDLEKLKFNESDKMDLFDSDDAEMFWEGMVPDSAIVALAIEHVWAIDLVNDLVDAGAVMAVNYRVPAPVVDEAFASLTDTN